MGRRVALLARPGIACDRLRGALVEAGAQLVLEADPLTLDPAVLGAAQAHVVMVALDAQTEDALDRFEAALQDPAIEVIFEEAELAAKREGWEAARWVRHLAAKLHRHGDVLPPGSESASTTAFIPDPASARPSTFESPGTPALDFTFEVEAAQPATIASTPFVFDPLLAEMSFDEPARADDADERGLPRRDPAADSRAADASPSPDSSLDFSYGSFDPVAAEMSADVDTASGVGRFGFDQDDGLSLNALLLDELRVEPDLALQGQGFNQMFDGDFAAAAAEAGLEVVASAPPGLDVPVANPLSGGIKRVLELVSADDGAPPDSNDSAAPSSDGAVADHRFKHDLASLESRIAGMELVDDRVVKGPAQANGAVLVMAGIGGPDAVRQLIGALPVGFARPVLVQQRLDGGRYDKLVAQMQRATSLEVKLAEPGMPATDGVIYILPAGVCIQLGDTGILFTGGGDDVLAVLPSADSAVLLLSGSDPAQVDAVMNHSWAGALVIGQAPDNCYDAAAPSALVARGGESGQPAELARRLAERWRS